MNRSILTAALIALATTTACGLPEATEVPEGADQQKQPIKAPALNGDGAVATDPNAALAPADPWPLVANITCELTTPEVHVSYVVQCLDKPRTSRLVTAMVTDFMWFDFLGYGFPSTGRVSYDVGKSEVGRTERAEVTARFDAVSLTAIGFGNGHREWTITFDPSTFQMSARVSGDGRRLDTVLVSADCHLVK